jgi:hypothetical protein
LNPDFFERAFPKNSPVPDAVEGDTARETKVARAGDCVRVTGETQHHFFGHGLDGTGEIHVPLV